MAEGATVAFVNIFGGVLGNLLNLFVAISCAGTMNGLMLGCCRGVYSLAARGEGPAPELFGEVGRKSNMPGNSAIFGLLLYEDMDAHNTRSAGQVLQQTRSYHCMAVCTGELIIPHCEQFAAGQKR